MSLGPHAALDFIPGYISIYIKQIIIIDLIFLPIIGGWSENACSSCLLHKKKHFTWLQYLYFNPDFYLLQLID